MSIKKHGIFEVADKKGQEQGLRSVYILGVYFSQMTEI